MIESPGLTTVLIPITFFSLRAFGRAAMVSSDLDVTAHDHRVLRWNEEPAADGGGMLKHAVPVLI